MSHPGTSRPSTMFPTRWVPVMYEREHLDAQKGSDDASTPLDGAEGAWVVDAKELGRRPGQSRAVRTSVSLDYDIGVSGVVQVTARTPFELDLLLESVVEGVLVTGNASTTSHGQCSRCLDPLTEDVEVSVTELFAYPDSATEATTDEDEVSHLENEQVDLEPLVRDAVALALPLVPLCSDDCQGLCAGCGMKWAELEPEHEHESIDPRWAALIERFESMSRSADDEYPTKDDDEQ